MGVDFIKLVSWYIGIYENDPGYLEFLESLKNHHHWTLIEDKELLKKYKSYLDPKRIPEKYKSNKDYYKDYESTESIVYPTYKLEKNNILLRDLNINTQVKKLFNKEISPMLVDRTQLLGLPKAYFVLFEFDELKDEGILYAEKLQEANVDVDIAFYEEGFHGIIFFECDTTRKIQKDLISFLKKNL